MKLLRAMALALATLGATSCTTIVVPDAKLAAQPEPALPRVGMWLHPDIELDRWICAFEASPENTTSYVHTEIRPSVWRQVAAHSSVIVLNNFIFADPQPWSVFDKTRPYEEYIAEFESYPAGSPEGIWYRQLNDNIRTPLAQLEQSSDPTSRKLIYIYAHMFGYDPEYASSIGLEPIRSPAYAWPPKGLQGRWPASFLFEERNGALRPSFKMPGTQTAMGNAVYFYLKYFENIGAEVHLTPWREVNGYADSRRCPSGNDGNCGLDSWQDLYDTYEAIVKRVGEGHFGDTPIAVYPTLQLESFKSPDAPCVHTNVAEEIKQFYSLNEASGVPFAIGVSTYPSIAANGLDTYDSKLRQLLDNLDSDAPTSCESNGDPAATSSVATSIRLPRSTPLTVGETSLPPWLSFQSLDTQSVMNNEQLGSKLALTHLGYHYTARDGSTAYPLEFVAFSLGPNWAFPVNIHGMRITWITTSAGLARYWLSPMQPLAGQLELDIALDPDGDWDNDGVPSIALDNCPYQPNPSQEDSDKDGIGDVCDNCLNIANYAQEDWDQDGFGSACDPDVNNDGLLQESVDLAVVKQCQGAAIDCLAHVTFPDLPAGQSTPDVNGKVVLIADMDADEDVDADDLIAWRRLAADSNLRESGFSCAGTFPCPDPAVVMLRDGSTVKIPGPMPDRRRACTPGGWAAGPLR